MTAEDVYVDPSALARLYIHQPGSREISAWLAKVSGALPVTHHGRTEVINAIGRVFMTPFDDPFAILSVRSKIARSGQLEGWRADQQGVPSFRPETR